jgi:hypothetical protein
MTTTDPYTVRIFVKEGDPEGIRIIDQMNWTGQAIVFPREKWADARKLKEFDLPGVYILSGFGGDESELPTIYVGEGDGIRARIDQHAQTKDFWTMGVAFVSKDAAALNKAHIQWLEYALVRQAREVQRCKLDNGNAPQEPAMADIDKAGTRTFFKEILKILPLVGLRAFETPRVIVSQPLPQKHEPVYQTSPSAPAQANEPDTIIVPALKEGFQEVFLGKHCWFAIRIAGGMLTKIKWIAAYQSQPISAVTHVAPVKHIEPYGDSGKYKVVFAEPARPITLIPYGDAPSGFMQGPRYTTYSRLMTAKSVQELVGK